MYALKQMVKFLVKCGFENLTLLRSAAMRWVSTSFHVADLDLVPAYFKNEAMHMLLLG